MTFLHLLAFVLSFTDFNLCFNSDLVKGSSKYFRLKRIIIREIFLDPFAFNSEFCTSDY